MENLQIRIKRPPASPSDLELVAAPRPVLTNGSFLARALWLALDPFRCAADGTSPELPRPGDVVPARGVAEVIESRHDVFGVGSLAELDCGLQQLCVSDGRHARLLHPGQTPVSTALGVLGAPGMAAYFGLLHLGRLRRGDVVLVSAAANAAGAMAGQVAMLKGARAIGVAGTGAAAAAGAAREAQQAEQARAAEERVRQQIDNAAQQAAAQRAGAEEQAK